MTYTNEGIQELHKVGIRNEAGQTPTYLSFAGSDNTYTGLETSITNEFIRKVVAWEQSGINSLYSAELTSAEAIGSNIVTLCLVGGSGIGSDIIFTIDESFIGIKGNTFDVQIEGEIVIERPV